MPFTKDTASKAGKKSTRKGSPNKTTEEIRENFQLLVSNNLEQLEDDLRELEPEKRVKLIIELSKFVIPTLRATDLTTSDDSMQPVIISLGRGINPEAEDNE